MIKNGHLKKMNSKEDLNSNSANSRQDLLRILKEKHERFGEINIGRD